MESWALIKIFLRLGIHPTGFCDRCPEIETVRNYLIDCPKYIIERAMLLSELNESQPGQIMEYLKKKEIQEYKMPYYVSFHERNVSVRSS